MNGLGEYSRNLQLIIGDLNQRLADVYHLFGLLTEEANRVANAEEDLLYQAATLAGMSSWDLYRDHSPAPRTLVNIQYDDISSTSSELGEEEQREIVLGFVLESVEKQERDSQEEPEEEQNPATEPYPLRQPLRDIGNYNEL